MTVAALHLEKHLPVTLTAPGLSEAEFLALTQDFPDCFLEYTSEGTVLVMPPTDPDTGVRVFRVGLQLGKWAEVQGRGLVLGPDAGFFLPEGSRRSPDWSWFDSKRWSEAKRRNESQRPGTKFPVFAPEFVIEVRSPEQRARGLREKMTEYIANGVQLGWLIDTVEHTVAIYRPGREPEVLTNPATVAGEGPVEGFVLDLAGII
jgi:Uma2 family endonuclease